MYGRAGTLDRWAGVVYGRAEVVIPGRFIAEPGCSMVELWRLIADLWCFIAEL